MHSFFGDSGLVLLLLKKNGGLGTTRRFLNKTNRNTQTNRAETGEKFGSLVLQRNLLQALVSSV